MYKLLKRKKVLKMNYFKYVTETFFKDNNLDFEVEFEVNQDQVKGVWIKYEEAPNKARHWSYIDFSDFKTTNQLTRYLESRVEVLIDRYEEL